jgi:hypothetical protein
MQKALIHRYDNKPDILEVEKHCCSEVYRRSKDDTFDVVIVVPTGTAGTQIAVVGDATSGQYTPPESKPWPGRPDVYPIRVDLTNFRRTTLDRVREAVEATGQNWAGQWTVRMFAIDETLL